MRAAGPTSNGEADFESRQLGLISYRAYWAEIIVDIIVTSPDGDISIDEIAQRTSMLHTDVLNTCQVLGILKQIKGVYVLAVSDTVVQQHERKMEKSRTKTHIHPGSLRWTPPVYTRDQVRHFGWPPYPAEPCLQLRFGW